MSSSLNSNGVPTIPAGRPARYMMVGGKGGGWDRPQEPAQPVEETMVEQIGKTAEQSRDGVVPGQTETADAVEVAPNTKKRMMEVEPSAKVRDEL